MSFNLIEKEEDLHKILNNLGKELEKEGKIDEAIDIYEDNVLLKTDTPFTYLRLSILYKKNKDVDNEIRINKIALKNIKHNKNSKYKEDFKKRLEKSKKRKTKIKTKRLQNLDKNHKDREQKAKELIDNELYIDALELLKINFFESSISDTTYDLMIKIFIELKSYYDALNICFKAIDVYNPINNVKVNKFRKKSYNIVDKYIKSKNKLLSPKFFGKYGSNIEYQKECMDKITELCGDYIHNDNFKKRAGKYKSVDGLTNTYEKRILIYECEDESLKLDSIENRLNELLKIDAKDLHEKIINKNSNVIEVDTSNSDELSHEDYLIKCDEKISDLCGGFICNDDFKKRAGKYKSVDDLTNTYEKRILMSECENGTLKLDSIEDRLDELLQLDCKKLCEISSNEDSSLFKTQSDIENYIKLTLKNKKEIPHKKYLNRNDIIKMKSNGKLSEDNLAKCEEKINYICRNDEKDHVKLLLKYETEKGLLSFNSLVDRRNQLISMDSRTLYNVIRFKEDTYAFKSQQDIDNFMGEEYSRKDLIKCREKINLVCRYDEEKYTKLLLNYEAEKGWINYNSIIYRYSQLNNMDCKNLYEVIRLKEDTYKFKSQKDIDKYMGNNYSKTLKLKYKNNKTNYSKKENNYRKNANSSISKTNISNSKYNNTGSYPRQNQSNRVSPDKNKLINTGKVNIELLDTVKSNTALASTGLYLLTGFFIGEAKEETKWINTELEIKNDRVITKKPYKIYKFKDFKKMYIDDSSSVNVFCICLKNKSRLIFKVRNDYFIEYFFEKMYLNGVNLRKLVGMD